MRHVTVSKMLGKSFHVDITLNVLVILDEFRIEFINQNIKSIKLQQCQSNTISPYWFFLCRLYL